MTAGTLACPWQLAERPGYSYCGHAGGGGRGCLGSPSWGRNCFRGTVVLVRVANQMVQAEATSEEHVLGGDRLGVVKSTRNDGVGKGTLQSSWENIKIGSHMLPAS